MNFIYQMKGEEEEAKSCWKFLHLILTINGCEAARKRSKIRRKARTVFIKNIWKLTQKLSQENLLSLAKKLSNVLLLLSVKFNRLPQHTKNATRIPKNDEIFRNTTRLVLQATINIVVVGSELFGWFSY